MSKVNDVTNHILSTSMYRTRLREWITKIEVVEWGNGKVVIDKGEGKKSIV